MKILLVNDDGYKAKGINALAKIMKQFGEVTVLAPKTHQSGTSMAISLGPKPIAYKDLGIIDGVRWMYLDGTPASCAKFALDVVFADSKPDVVISGINHGSNASTAMWYSGTVGAAREAALDGSVGIAVSLDNLHPDADFSVVEELFPDVFRKLVANLPQGRKVIYNINFPDLPASEIKGVRVATQGYECWVNEFVPYDLAFFKSLNLAAGAPAGLYRDVEEGEVLYMMAGEVCPSPDNDGTTDNRLGEQGYITITPQQFDNTDMEDYHRLSKIFG